MTADKQLVTVTIGGEDYTLRSDRPAEYTRRVAEHVDRRLREVRAAGAIIESHKAAVLAALAITDELFQAQRAQREIADRLAALTQELSRLLPPAKRASKATGAFASPRDGA